MSTIGTLGIVRATKASLAFAGLTFVLTATAAAFAGGMSDVQSDKYALPTVDGHSRGMPIGILQQIVIDKDPRFASHPEALPSARVLPPLVTPMIARYKYVPKLPPTPSASIVDEFDPAIYCVYGILTSDGVAQAIVGLAGGDGQVVRIGDFVGDTPAMVAEIRPDGIAVRVGNAKRLEQIGFTGGERLAPTPVRTMPAGIVNASMPSVTDIHPLPPVIRPFDALHSN